MSGHSHAATIKHQKEATDQKRGAAFSKLARVITIATRFGTDPNTNFKLRLAIEKARQINMPKVNIERAMTKGNGEAGGNLEEATYEGYGPGKIAVIVEVVTDNKNRTLSDIKNIFERHGGSLAGPGSVSYQFARMGKIIVDKPGNSEEAILKIMDLGVENLEEVGESIEVYTPNDKLEQIADQITRLGLNVQEKDSVMHPKMTVAIDDPGKKEKIHQFINALKDNDDVQEVFANPNFTV